MKPGSYYIDAVSFAARMDEMREWQRQTNEPCRHCGRETPRGHARCGHCNRTLWRVRGEDQR